MILCIYHDVYIYATEQVTCQRQTHTDTHGGARHATDKVLQGMQACTHAGMQATVRDIAIALGRIL